MDLSLELELRSPLLAGAGRQGGAFSPTLGYVPGRVLRAAVARALLAQCPYFVPAVQGHGRQFWVEYRGEAACATCPWRRWCQAFGEIRFHDATVEGAEVYPATAMHCKYDKEWRHRPVDALAAWVRHGEWLAEPGWNGGDAPEPDVCCPHCGHRVEACHGEHLDGRPIEVPTMLLTHVGINSARSTAEEGLLFSVQAISPLRQERRDGQDSWQPTRLMAPVTVPDALPGEPARGAESWGLPVAELGVGARTSSGMGRCIARVTPAPARTAAEPVDALAGRVRRLTELVGAGREWHYAALLLRSDAELDMAPRAEPPHGTDTRAFLVHLERALGLGAGGWELRYAFADHAFRGGWDTSRPAGQRYQEPALYLLRGSVLVLRRQGPLTAAAVAALAAMAASGIGRRTADGLGQVAVCHRFHIDYAL